MRSVKIITFLGVMLFCAIAQAQTVRMYICDACSDSQYKSKAESNPPMFEQSIAYVLDTEREIVTKWSVWAEEEYGITIRHATPVTVDSTMSQNFDKYISVLEDVRAPIIVWPGEWPSGPYESAYDLVGNPNGLNDLYDWFKSQYNWVGWGLTYFTGISLELTTKVVNLWTSITFNFDDGSYIVLKAIDWDLGSLDFRFEYHYAEDPIGDIIPLDPVDYDPGEPVPYTVREYITNNGYVPVDQWGAVISNWSMSTCYGLSCSIIGPDKLCVVAPTSCP